MGVFQHFWGVEQITQIHKKNNLGFFPAQTGHQSAQKSPPQKIFHQHSSHARHPYMTSSLLGSLEIIQGTFQEEVVPTFQRFDGTLSLMLPSLKRTFFAPENRPKSKRKRIVFQPSIFRGENVSFREGISELRLENVVFSEAKKVDTEISPRVGANHTPPPPC